MFYGMSGYQEDLQAWEAAVAARESWFDARDLLQNRWDQYERLYAEAKAACDAARQRYAEALASRNAYLDRYRADLQACQVRVQMLESLMQSTSQWSNQYGVKPVIFSKPICATWEKKQEWQRKCDQAVRGIDGLGALATDSIRNVGATTAEQTSLFNLVQTKTGSQNPWCIMAKVPTCPAALPDCQNLGPPGRAPSPPTSCSYPPAPASMTSIGPMPPDPGRRPQPPESTTTTVVVEPGPEDTTTTTTDVVEETEDGKASSFAMYGILALLLLGGGYLVYRTVK